jgi:hypothetical protein
VTLLINIYFLLSYHFNMMIDHHRDDDDNVSFVVLEISVSSINISVYFLTVSPWLCSGFKTHLLELTTCFGA